MSQLLQEYVHSGSHKLRVDREAGVVRGVKLLGLASRNGRRYREAALAEAVALYEGAKVNINHPKGHPLSPRDYQDRLGMVRSVEFRAGEGLFGDLHFNPRHALSEQLIWDAEHAPQNVGMSHNVLARTSQSGDETVVEAITKVQSIDLVADPATTSGLFEHAADQAHEGRERRPFAWDALALDELRRHRPDLVREIEESASAELESLRRELDTAAAREALEKRRARIAQLLEEHELPPPGAAGESISPLVSERFMQTLVSAPDDETLVRLVEERAQLVRWARSLADSPRGRRTRPTSRDQLEVVARERAPRVNSGKELAALVRGN